MRRHTVLFPLMMLAACEIPSPDQTGDTAVPTETVDGLAPVCTAIPEGGSGACFAENSPIPFRMLGPNVQLVVDRSGSMQGQKWSELQALTAFLPEVGTRANLGLSLFSSPNGDGACGTAGSRVVPLGEGPQAAAEVSDWLLKTEPYGSTPIAATLSQLVGAPGLQCPNRDNIVVLLTDGEESCGGNPVVAVRELVSQPEPVEVYVIGFGTDADTDEALNRIADAAIPTTGTDNFYTASTAGELVARLAAVTATCTAQVDADFDPDQLLVTLDGVELTECTEDRCESGYTIDEEFGNVRIEGMDCLALLDGTCHDLRFAEGG